MLMAVTCEAFECARAPALESERDELAAGDGERGMSAYSDAGEQCVSCSAGANGDARVGCCPSNGAGNAHGFPECSQGEGYAGGLAQSRPGGRKSADGSVAVGCGS